MHGAALHDAITGAELAHAFVDLELDAAVDDEHEIDRVGAMHALACLSRTDRRAAFDRNCCSRGNDVSGSGRRMSRHHSPPALGSSSKGPAGGSPPSLGSAGGANRFHRSATAVPVGASISRGGGPSLTNIGLTVRVDAGHDPSHRENHVPYSRPLRRPLVGGDRVDSTLPSLPIWS